MTRDHKAGTILTFAMGAAAGAVAALLLAPKTGEELRGDIAAGVSDGVNQVRGTGKDLKRRTQKTVALAQDQVQDTMEAGQEAYSQAKQPSSQGNSRTDGERGSPEGPPTTRALHPAEKEHDR